MNESHRAFIAVRVPASPELLRVLGRIDACGQNVRTIHSERLHLTLRFLGDIEPRAVSSINAALECVCSSCARFTLIVRGLDAFPGRQRPSVVWAGIDGAEPLIDIADELEKALRRKGFPRADRPFRPHLTLARIRNSRRRGHSQPAPNLESLFAEFGTVRLGTLDVDRVVLYRSELRADGPVYTELAAVVLGADSAG